MSHLALLPILETLPGWPEVVEPSLLESVAIMLLIPTGITAVVALAVLGPAWFAHSREKTGSELEVAR